MSDWLLRLVIRLASAEHGGIYSPSTYFFENGARHAGYVSFV